MVQPPKYEDVLPAEIYSPSESVYKAKQKRGLLRLLLDEYSFN